MFKCKKYKQAIISYTEGLNQKIESDRELSSTLHSNRSAAHYHLANYRSAFNDAVFARKFNAKNFKAVLRGAQCCFQLRMYDDAVQWSDAALALNPADEASRDLRRKSEIAKVMIILLSMCVSCLS
jgi:tetratricopeptide (TPR) repeat protein